MEIWERLLGSRFYIHNVVGVNTYSIDTKMGGGKRPAVTFWMTYRAKICLEMVLGFGEILYWHNVVGGGVNYNYVIYGGRTSLFLSSQRMPAATMRLRTYTIKKFIGGDDIFL